MKTRSHVNPCCGIIVTAIILGGLFQAQTFEAKPPPPTPTASPTPTPISSTNCPPPPNGTAPVAPPTGGFAIDGDLQANTPVNNVGDWLPAGNGTGGAVLTSAGAPVNSALTFHLIDPYSVAENNFAGGKKVDDNPNTWTWVTNPVNSKQDINNALLHFTTDANGHNWVIVSGDRLSTSGNAYIDFEFLQKTLTANSDGTFTSAGQNGGRSVNDFILTINFTNGGTNPGVCVSRWMAVGSGFDYVDATSALAGAGTVFAAVNTGTITVPYGAFGNNTYVQNAWAEAAVDLTALLNNFDNRCLSVGIKTIFVKTKESQSPTATIVDFITPKQVDIKLGPASANAGGPYAAKCSAGPSGTTFNLHGTASAGSVSPITSMAWTSVPAGTATFNPQSCTGSNVTTCDTVATVTGSSATVRLTVTDASGCTSTDDAVLTVNERPTPTITPSSAQICAGGSQMFTVNISGGTSPYTINWSGPGGFTSSSSSITVSTGGTYSVTVTDANGCSNNTSASLTVNPNPQVTISGPASCGTVPVTLSANVTSGTGPFSYLWSGPGGFTSTASSISISTGGVYGVQVTDSKGCGGSASRTVGLCFQ